jgi:hypothetical protein
VSTPNDRAGRHASEPIATPFYEARAERYGVERDRLAKVSLRVSNARGLAFVVFAGGGGFALFGSGGIAAAIVSALGLLGFIALVVYHSKVIDQQALAERWVQVNRDAAARVTPNGWHKLPHDGRSFRDIEHPYLEDLDIVGHGSLFQRLCTAQTQVGQSRLFGMLSRPCSGEELVARQQSVRTLAPQLEFRQHLEVLAMGTRSLANKSDVLAAASNLEPFLQWAEAARDANELRRFGLLSWALPIATATVTILVLLGTLPLWVMFAFLALHLMALVKARPHLQTLVRALSKAEGMVERAGPLFQLMEGNAEVGWIRQRLTTGKESASVALRRLSRIGGWFELRHNGLVYPFVNLAVLWDVHCWLGFEHWQANYGTKARDWFATFGDIEALCSLANLAHDEPGCCYAEMVTDGPGIEALAVGHPLIPVAERVTNDVTGLNPGFGLLVTGSNMSGKSTYLRAIGMAAVLGLAGGPVCAERLRVRQLQLITSMRISDSVAGGVSHFYAELLKLKRVLDAANGAEPVLFLLDEILHGTNSRERQIGARYTVAELLRANAFGAVSTHDSGLCALTGELAARLTQVHFRESVAQDQMIFDYKVYPGPVTEGNALRLMQRVGIPVPLEPLSANEP